MTQESAVIVNIHRPKILMQAARMCAKGYRRETMLPRLLGASSARVVELLKVREDDLEQERQARAGTYSAQAHVEVLSALLAESKKAA
ncbi:MAG: hypothetical protein GQ535_12180 [Rhodobacteraceae bacterium]|nr:hypothetical protein [Paracoccaceae bacterium]